VFDLRLLKEKGGLGILEFKLGNLGKITIACQSIACSWF